MVAPVLLDIFYTLAMAVSVPWILYRMVARGRYRSGWKERFGGVPKRYSFQPCIWVHAVSVGEVNAARTLVERLERVLPQYEIVLSTTTDTGVARLRQLYGQTHRVFFFPFDFSWAVRRALGRVRPELCILMEGEVWPNFTAVAEKRGIAVIVANGRISTAKGYPRYRRIAPLLGGMFSRLTLVLVQEEIYAERFRQLGAPPEKVKVVGSLKYDTAAVVDRVEGTDELAGQLALQPDEMIWVAGSTGPGEEEIILRTFKQLKQKQQLNKLRLMMVPRKPERFDEMARLIEASSHRCVRYSRVKAGEYEVGDQDRQAVILGDTMGDLRKFYSLAQVILVGRSLIPMGGSDMMEAAGLAKPIVVGAYTENFAEGVRALVEGDGIEVVADERQLAEVVERLLVDRQKAERMARRARQVIIDNQGATERTVEEVVKILGFRMPLGEAGIATPAMRSTEKLVNGGD